MRVTSEWKGRSICLRCGRSLKAALLEREPMRGRLFRERRSRNVPKGGPLSFPIGLMALTDAPTIHDRIAEALEPRIPMGRILGMPPVTGLALPYMPLDGNSADFFRKRSPRCLPISASSRLL